MIMMNFKDDDPHRIKACLALLNSTGPVLGLHQSPRERAKKLLIARVRRVFGEFIDAIGDEEKLLLRSLTLQFGGEQDARGKDGENAGEIVAMDGDGFRVIVHFGA